MSFFNELKRRNVVRVAIAYAVASWVLIQIGDVAAQNFEAPVWVMKMFMTAMMAGFPIVLFFSWAYEITPDGIKKELEIDHSQSVTQETGKKLEYVTIALLVIAISFIAFDRLSPESAATPSSVTTTTTSWATDRATISSTVTTATISSGSSPVRPRTARATARMWCPRQMTGRVIPKTRTAKPVRPAATRSTSALQMRA